MNTNHVVSLISNVRAKANNLIAAELERHNHTGLVPSHGAILRALFMQGPQPMSALANAIGRQKNTVTSLVQKLEKAGYVSRAASPADSRVTIVSLTEKGKASQTDFEEISRTLLDAVWGDMPQGEREALVAGLERLLKNLG